VGVGRGSGRSPFCCGGLCLGAESGPAKMLVVHASPAGLIHRATSPATVWRAQAPLPHDKAPHVVRRPASATMPHDVRRPHRGRQAFEIGAQNGERDIVLLPLWKCNREPTPAAAVSVIGATSPIRRQSCESGRIGLPLGTVSPSAKPGLLCRLEIALRNADDIVRLYPQ
jgi:hypothetical protein